MNFEYQTSNEREFGLYFNSKGHDLRIYTRLVGDNARSKSEPLEFPSEQGYDA